MALLHKATLTPSKPELMNAWLTARPWLPSPGEARPVAAYRFDDPDGEVGIETALLQTTDGSVVQVPLTYRGAPLDGADDALIGTTEHSVLGPRWVYDGCGDPVWAAAFATAVLTGGTQAEQYFEVDGRREVREPSATVRGSGTPGTAVPAITVVTCEDDGPATVVRAGELELVVVRVVGADVVVEQTLTGRWGDSGLALLGGVRRA